MSTVIASIAAEAERPRHGFSEASGHERRRVPVENLPTHQFPVTSPSFAKSAKGGAPIRDKGSHFAQNQQEAGNHTFHDRERERRTYRGRTVAMLRRYMRYSIETGRLPSLLGREFFRTRVTSYKVGTFEDRVIFVHDMESCLDRLDEFSRELIARHILQEHDQEATARLLHCNQRTVRRWTPLVLDQLSDIMLEMGLLERIEVDAEISCQEDESKRIYASDCEDSRNKSGEMSG